MDQYRQIRFLIPPFFLISSLLWGTYWSDPSHLSWQSMMQNGVLKYIGITVASILPLGYLIGTITVLFLKLFWLLFPYNYESIVSAKTLANMSKSLNCGSYTRNYEDKGLFTQKRIGLNVGVLFIHEYVKNRSEATIEWLARRWNAMNIAFNSITALVLAIVIGSYAGIEINSLWIYSTLLLIAIFLIVGVLAWRDVVKMIEFLSTLADSDSDRQKSMAVHTDQLIINIKNEGEVNPSREARGGHNSGVMSDEDT